MKKTSRYKWVRFLRDVEIERAPAPGADGYVVERIPAGALRPLTWRGVLYRHQRDPGSFEIAEVTKELKRLARGVKR